MAIRPCDVAIRPCDEGDDELARRDCFLSAFFAAVTLVLCFFLEGIFLALWVGAVRCRCEF